MSGALATHQEPLDGPTNPLPSQASFPSTIPRAWLQRQGVCLRGHGVLVGRESGLLVLARCQQWQCEVCGKSLQWRFVFRALTYDFGWHWTITCGWQWTASTAKKLNAAVRQVIWRLRHWYDLDLEIVAWGNERGPHGQHCLHKHILVRGPRWISYALVRDVLVSCGLGRQCRFVRVKNRQRAAHYVAKYVAKSAQNADGWRVPRYSRRTWVRYAEWPALDRQFEPMRYVRSPGAVGIDNRLSVADNHNRAIGPSIERSRPLEVRVDEPSCETDTNPWDAIALLPPNRASSGPLCLINKRNAVTRSPGEVWSGKEHVQ